MRLLRMALLREQVWTVHWAPTMLCCLARTSIIGIKQICEQKSSRKELQGTLSLETTKKLLGRKQVC